MSKRNAMAKPKSLAQHFEAPDDFLGRFGWICGYSADDGFLNDAVERFTRRTDSQRAYEGRIAIAMMLDPSNKQISLKDVPGVLHLPINQERPFNLIHAKIAILGFHHETDPKQWRIRLIVSTGNWTRATLEDSLDLVWCIDLPSDEIRATEDSVAQVCADISAAWDMMQWLLQFFKIDALMATHPDREESTTQEASQSVRQWLDKIRKRRRGASPQFLDNRRASLLDQLPVMIRQHCGKLSRNYLAMGSGFYETPNADGAVPSVLQKIVARLQDGEKPLLTQKPEVDVFVNPKACQAVAGSLAAIHELGWAVRCAWKPKYFAEALRNLHAKFIFSFNYRENSNSCNSAWLYLGSGNLTASGFANKMSPNGGNLEAGVVFAPNRLFWAEESGVQLEHVVSNVLPIQQENEIDEDSGLLQSGKDMPEPEHNFIAAPIVILYWSFDGASGWLLSGDATEMSYELLGESKQPCSLDPDRGFQWSGTRPREVQVRWQVNGKTLKAWVPVMDEFGRIAATTLPRMDLDEAWAQLDSFPMPPDDEDLAGEGRDVTDGDDDNSGSHANTAAVYPVRQMMQLIENIATKQTSVSQTDWTTWCTRLEQCLIQSAGSMVLEQFKELKLNPISPLRQAPFRPEFALSSETSEGKRYEKTLARIEIAWSVDTFENIGALK